MNESNTIPMTNCSCATYLQQVVNMNSRREFIPRFAEFIVSCINSETNFDTIVFRGMSGALIAPSISDILGIPFLMVRKSIEDNHSGRYVEGHVSIRKYCIIDDLICSGNTVQSIIDALKNNDMTKNAECSSIFLYLGENSKIGKFSPRNADEPYTIPFFTFNGLTY